MQTKISQIFPFLPSFAPENKMYKLNISIIIQCFDTWMEGKIMIFLSFSRFFLSFDRAKTNILRGFFSIKGRRHKTCRLGFDFFCSALSTAVCLLSEECHLINADACLLCVFVDFMFYEQTSNFLLNGQRFRLTFWHRAIVKTTLNNEKEGKFFTICKSTITILLIRS